MSEKELKTAFGVLGGGVLILGMNKLHDVSADWLFTSMQASAKNTVVEAATPMQGIEIGINGGQILGATMLGASIGLYLLRSYLYTPKMDAIRVSPSKDHDIDPKLVPKLVDGFGGIGNGIFQRILHGRMWFRYLILKDEQGKISFYYLVPRDYSYIVRDKIKDYYPKALVRIEKEFTIPFFEPGKGYAGHMMFPLFRRGHGLSNELHNDIGYILSRMPNESIIDIRFSSVKNKELREESRKVILKNKEMEAKKKLPEDTNENRELTQRYYGRSQFNVSINLWAKNSEIKALAGEIRQHTKGNNNSLRLSNYWLLGGKASALNWKFTKPLPWRTMSWNEKELALLLMTPPVDHPVMEHIASIEDKKKPKPGELSQGQTIGKVDHEEMRDRDVKLKITTLTNHGLIAGMAGGGKDSTIATWMKHGFLKEWIKKPKSSPGLTYCDPHFEGIQNIINLLLEYERQGYEVPWDRVKCYSVGTLGFQGYPVAMNLLHRTEDDIIDDVEAETVEIITSAFGGDLSRSVSYLSNLTQTLLWSEDVHTIADIPRLLMASEERFRNRLIKQIKNPMILNWWKQLESKFEEGKDISVEAINTRLNPFLSKQSMQRLFCQKGNSFNVKEIFRNGELVLVDFLGAPPEAYKLVAGWIANRYFRGSQQRGTNGRPHFLIFNEVQKFHVPTFAKIIRENRKFDMGLILMTQEVERLDNELKSAIKSNAGFVISVRQQDGAGAMADLLNHEFTAAQLRKLEKGREAVLRSFDGSCNLSIEFPAFYDEEGNITPYKSPEEQRAKEIAKQKFIELQKRHSKHYTEVDREIAEMMDMEVEEEKKRKKQRRKVAGV